MRVYMLFYGITYINKIIKHPLSLKVYNYEKKINDIPFTRQGEKLF